VALERWAWLLLTRGFNAEWLAYMHLGPRSLVDVRYSQRCPPKSVDRSEGRYRTFISQISLEVPAGTFQVKRLGFQGQSDGQTSALLNSSDVTKCLACPAHSAGVRSLRAW